MHTSHILFLLPCLSSFVGALPAAKDAEIEGSLVNKEVEADSTICEDIVVTKTVYGPRPSHGKHHHHHHDTNFAGSSTVTALFTPTAAHESSTGSDQSSLQAVGEPSIPTVSPKTPTTSMSSVGEYEPAATSSIKASSKPVPVPTVSSASQKSTSSVDSAAPSATAKSGKYPFSSLIAFGDNLSDNGNGSYAHHVTDKNNPNNKVYGAGTWTNEQVAVSYLTDHLNVPMTKNFAFGHAWGGADFGATIDNTIATSDFHDANVAAELGCPGAPPASQQIETYIKGGVSKEAMHFLWIGNNDINIAHAEVGWDNSKFASNVSEKISTLIETLLDAGAPYVFVANLYPKHLAPVSWKYFGYNNVEKQTSWGNVINEANTALEKAISTNSKFNNKVIYYDVFKYMSSIWDNASNNGITNKQDTNGFPAFCDGDPDKTANTVKALAAGTIPVKSNPSGNNNWGLCVDEHEQETFYWMQYLDMTSKVHKLVASDMASTISNYFLKK